MAGAQQNIVIVGASFAGLQTTHYILKHVVPKLANPQSYHVVLINTSRHFFHNISVPRAIVAPEEVPTTTTFSDIAEGFSQYNAKSFTFVEGKVSQVDTQARVLTIEKCEGDQDSLTYHALILASGTRTPSPLFQVGRSSDETRSTLERLRSTLSSAKTIVIGGGGPTGVETAGELGEYLNGTAGWFRSRPSTTRCRVLVVTSSHKLLPLLRESTALDAEKYLNRVGADVIYNARIASVSPSDAGYTPETVVPGEKDQKVQVKLDNGTVLEADIFIPAMGTKPNSEYMPAEAKDDRGYIKTDGMTLRVVGAGPRVYSIGDVSSASSGGVGPTIFMHPVLATNLKRDLRAYADGKTALTTGQDRPYKAMKKGIFLVPIGRGKGVGEIFGWWVPSWLVWLIKGRSYMTTAINGYVRGLSVAKESIWKFE